MIVIGTDTHKGEHEDCDPAPGHVRRLRGDNNSVSQPEINVDYLLSHVRELAEQHLELLERLAEDLAKLRVSQRTGPGRPMLRLGNGL